ncbi:unnamed protein product, partial [Durusdinium trenchii]
NASMSWGMERNNDSCTITTVAKAECMQIEKPKRVRDASNRRRGGYKYQKQLQNRMREQERIEQADQISQALNIMGSL